MNTCPQCGGRVPNWAQQHDDSMCIESLLEQRDELIRAARAVLAQHTDNTTSLAQLAKLVARYDTKETT